MSQPRLSQTGTLEQLTFVFAFSTALSDCASSIPLLMSTIWYQFGRFFRLATFFLPETKRRTPTPVWTRCPPFGEWPRALTHASVFAVKHL